MFGGIRENISPTITAAATLLIAVSVLLLGRSSCCARGGGDCKSAPRSRLMTPMKLLWQLALAAIVLAHPAGAAEREIRLGVQAGLTHLPWLARIQARGSSRRERRRLASAR